MATDDDTNRGDDQLPDFDLWSEELARWKEAKASFHVFLVNGIKLNFKQVLDYDDRCFKAVDENNTVQLVTFHAISTMLSGKSGLTAKRRAP